MNKQDVVKTYLEHLDKKIRSVSKEIEIGKKLLEETQKNLDFEQRLRKTYAEITEKEIKSKYFK